jgi:hypothetical protein
VEKHTVYLQDRKDINKYIQEDILSSPDITGVVTIFQLVDNSALPRNIGF